MTCDRLVYRLILAILGTLFAVSTIRAADTVVQVNGKALYVRIIEPAQRNAAVPTVVFETGLGNESDIWDRVFSKLRLDAPLIAYDRPGLGRSASDPEGLSTRRVAAVLHDALAKVGATPPYILVGHSWGGPRIRMFTAMYPTEVAGLVFVDPSDWTLTRDDELRHAYMPIGLGPTERDELDQIGEEGIKNTPEGVRAQFREVRQTLVNGFPEFRALPPLPDIPVVFLLSTREPGLSADVQLSFDIHRLWQSVLKVRRESIIALAGTIGEATVVVTPNSGHYIQYDEPDLVTWAIQRVVYPDTLMSRRSEWDGHRLDSIRGQRRGKVPRPS